MWRLRKFYYPYWANILIAALMVVVVAWSNLALPDYLSQIVNTGIQKNGIEHGVPEVMRQSTLDQVLALMTPEEQAELTQAYTLVEPDSPEASQYLAKYPVLETEAVYLFNATKSKDDIAHFEALMAKPLVITQAFNLIQNEPEQARQLLGNDFPFDFAQLPAGMDIAQMLAQMPDAQRLEMRQKIDAHLEQLEGTILRQMAISAVTDEYKAVGMDMAKMQRQYILITGARMIGMSVLAVVSSITVSLFAARTSTALARDIRAAVFKKVESFSSAEFGDFSTASLITRTSNDVMQVQMVTFMAIRMAIQAPMLGVLGVVRAMDKSPNMWWTIALAVVILVLFIILIFSLVTPRFKRMQALIDRLNLIMRENLSGILVVRAFNKQGFEIKRFDQANQDVAENMRGIGRTMSFMHPIMTLVMTGVQVLVIWVGAHQVAKSTMQVGDLMAFMQYAMQILSAFLNLSMFFIIMPRAAVSADRILEVLDR
ncbi:MAG TPA: ABC transporter permease, partial [Anaerolineaceae bacterium]|nr:ABC transporter permease [Anaerolineaceae bacterium]